MGILDRANEKTVVFFMVSKQYYSGMSLSLLFYVYKEKSLCNSFRKPSRSDFVQSEFIIINLLQPKSSVIVGGITIEKTL